jgi:Tfp pilus assembly protein PilO
MEKMRQWTILTAVGVLAVFAAGWFLLISPQRGHAADLRADATSQQQSNDQLRLRVTQLEAQKKGLPAQQRLLDQIAAKIPATPELPGLIRQLSTAAQAAGVDLVTLAPAEPALVAASAPTAAAPTTTGTTGTATTGTAGTTAAPAAASTLMQIPVSVTVRGTYFNVNTFFRNVEKLSRAMLVPEFKISPATDTPGGNGESADGATDQLTATLSTIVFESPEATAPVTPTAAQ